MRKKDFLARLCRGLAALPQAELEERVRFYSEMIDDRMEEGMSEEEAVGSIGDVNEIITQSLEDIHPALLIRQTEQSRERRRSRGLILLLILGSPLWLPLLIAFFAVVLSAYVSLWAVVVSLWGEWISAALCAPIGLLAGAAFICFGRISSGLALISASLVCAGIAIFLFFACKWITKKSLWLGKQMYLMLKRYFFGRKGVV